MVENDDPAAIHSVALSRDDVVDAYVYSRENPGEAVLRVTPPFHGRMRARIHVYRLEDAELTGAVHLSPAELIADDVVADYPEFGSELDGANDDETDTIRERRGEAVENWRERAREALVDAVALETDDGPRDLEVKPLG